MLWLLKNQNDFQIKLSVKNTLFCDKIKRYRYELNPEI